MKLDYLPEGSPDCPLIRLYDFTPIEAKQLLNAVASLASGSANRMELNGLPFVEAIGGCRLDLVSQTWDGAVVRIGGPNEFECGFTRDTWVNIVGLIEPFAEGSGGFQWIADVPGEANILLSQSGHW